MGIKSTKPWIPVNGFEQICKNQGFQAISPPVYHTSKTIHSIDLSNENVIYYVERSVQKPFSITNKYITNIETNKQTGNIIAIIKNSEEYYVLEMEQMIGTGDIHVISTDGNYRVERSYYTHEYFPQFSITPNKEYNRLKNLFQYSDYANILD